MIDQMHVNIRELSLETLLAILQEGRQSHFVIRDVLTRYGWLTDQERAFYLRLTEGTLEYQIRLDYILNLFSKTKTNRMKPVIREILRMGVYQLQFMDAVPDSAAVNESVRLAGRKGFNGLKGFVNGVLRNIARHPEKIIYPDSEDKVSYLSVMYSMPEALVEDWIRIYGPDTTEKICRGFLEQNQVTIRIRNPYGMDSYHIETGKAEADDSIVTGTAEKNHNHEEDQAAGMIQQIISGLHAEGARLERAPYVPDAWYLGHSGNPAELTAFDAGQIIMQDVSSQLAVRCAGIRPGNLVLDLCAAPGGKSILAADLMNGTGNVISCDLTDTKAEQLQENRERCHVTNMQIEVQDATIPVENRFGTADVVLADVPCSGYGVIGKKPEIKYRASREGRMELIGIQRKILSNAVSYVKPGGTLLFSTCTIGDAENTDTVKWLLDHFPLRAYDLTGLLPEELLTDARVRESARTGYVQLLPGVHGCDGFFFARFTRIS